MKNNIKIKKNLVNRLLSGEIVEIYNKQGIILPSEEKEVLRDVVYAQILEGKMKKVIVIFFDKEVHKTDKNEIEIYDGEEIYRLPYTKNKRWIRNALRNSQEQWHTSYANEI